MGREIPRFTISSRHRATFVMRLAYRRESYEDLQRSVATETSDDAQPDAPTMHRLRRALPDDQCDVFHRGPLRAVQLSIAIRMAHGLRSRTTYRRYSSQSCARALSAISPGIADGRLSPGARAPSLFFVAKVPCRHQDQRDSSARPAINPSLQACASESRASSRAIAL